MEILKNYISIICTFKIPRIYNLLKCLLNLSLGLGKNIYLKFTKWDFKIFHEHLYGFNRSITNSGLPLENTLALLFLSKNILYFKIHKIKNF